MTEIEYEHECSRAELLGLPKPSREEFFSRQNVINEENVEEEQLTPVQAEDKDVRREGLSRIGGGLDELNSILSNTQKKLNRFKNVCGSFTNLLRIGSKKEDENEGKQTEGSSNNECEEAEEKSICPAQSPKVIKKGGNTELDKLDSLISKAERAELSLSSQNKQMKKFLN